MAVQWTAQQHAGGMHHFQQPEQRDETLLHVRPPAVLHATSGLPQRQTQRLYSAMPRDYGDGISEGGRTKADGQDVRDLHQVGGDEGAEQKGDITTTSRSTEGKPWRCEELFGTTVTTASEEHVCEEASSSGH